MPRLTRRALFALAGAVPLASLDHGQAGAPRLPDTRAYLLYDVFTDRPYTGNQLGVFLEPAGLAPAVMHQMTRELNFSECTFVFPPEQAGTDIRLRIFGPGGEMPFAGHPVIGSTFALADEGRVAAGRGQIVLGLGLGPTPVELEWSGGRLAFAWMTQQRPTYGGVLADRAGVAGALGLEPSDLREGLPVQEVSCGSTFLFVPLISRAAVDRAALDRRRMEALMTTAGLSRRGVFLFSTEPGGDDATAYSRMLSFGVVEDPATGSASGPLGCYLVRHGLVPAARADAIVSAQGVKMGRPSRIHIRLDVQGEDVTRVRVGGTSVLVGEGRLRAS